MDTIKLWARNGEKVRKRASRRAVKGACYTAEPEARAQRVARKLVNW